MEENFLLLCCGHQEQAQQDLLTRNESAAIKQLMPDSKSSSNRVVRISRPPAARLEFRLQSICISAWTAVDACPPAVFRCNSNRSVRLEFDRFLSQHPMAACQQSAGGGIPSFTAGPI
jgi:hypothetical protein